MLFLGLVLSSILALAHPFKGQVSISGKACYGETALLPVAGEKNRYELPVRLMLDKKSKTPLERKTCNLRLPIVLQGKKKLQILDSSQIVHIDGRGVKSVLNISIVGKKSKSLVTTESKTLKQEGLIVESDCGRDVILKADLNVTASGTDLVSVKTEGPEVNLKIVKCD